MEFLGQIRRENGARRFVLATKANGFFSELPTETAACLAGIDGAQLTGDYGDDRLSADIRDRLGIA